ncbi:MAG: sigma-70 family RNA polymerase sigma factor, partial [Dethiobacteria bacterium]|nr:sigma-70 family RNA polymerase sigma factor [Dethiobacteria bacterium]
DPALAEDAIHSTFLKLAGKTAKIDDVFSKKTRGFLIIIARNAAIDLYRKRKNEIKNIDLNRHELAFKEANNRLPRDIIITNEEIEKVQGLINSLDSKYGDVLLLKYYNNLPNHIIAELLDISAENVAVRLCRAKNMLAEKLGGEVSGYEKTSSR